jgi:hypothetical protein
MQKRYTYYDSGHWRVKRGEQEIRHGFVDLLAKYENLHMTPEQIVDQAEMLRSYRNLFEGYSPDEIKQIISEWKKLKKESEKREVFFNKIDGLIEAATRRGGLV